MGIEGFSAVGAMHALRAQLEDRLNQSEDYRALKALEKAIADVLSNKSAAVTPEPIRLQEPTLILPSPGAPPASSTHASSLMQRITSNYANTARAA